jgi:hypothetical protein
MDGRKSKYSYQTVYTDTYVFFPHHEILWSVPLSYKGGAPRPDHRRALFGYAWSGRTHCLGEDKFTFPIFSCNPFKK